MLKQIAFLALLSLVPAAAEANFLWTVGTEKPSYLYGTVHSSDPAVRELPVEVLEALKESQTFHPELELSPENIGRLTGAILAPRRGNLEEELPRALWERLLQRSEQNGIPAGLLRRIPVQLVPLLFATPPEIVFHEIMDVQLYERARDNGLAIHQLETVDEQIGIFRSLDREQAIVILDEALAEAESNFPTQTEILRLYAAGELEPLESFMEEELARSGMAGLTEELILSRNRRMTERLLPYLEAGGAFVAVGVGHMPGSEGMVALLEERGYRVTRMPLGKKAAGSKADSLKKE